jgi:SAM-dependent methyltransferase
MDWLCAHNLSGGSSGCKLPESTILNAMDALPEYVLRNRSAWDEWANEFKEPGRHNWQDELSWGIWGVPESQLRVLPDPLEGLHVIELGCGTAYVSAWLARRGGRPVAIDNSEAQLATARAPKGVRARVPARAGQSGGSPQTHDRPAAKVRVQCRATARDTTPATRRPAFRSSPSIGRNDGRARKYGKLGRPVSGQT